MKNLKFCPIFLMLCLIFTLFAAPTSQALDDPEITADSVYLIDTKTQQVLYSKQAETSTDSVPLAQLVTIALTIDAIDHGTFSYYDSVVVPENFDDGLADSAARCGLCAGETVTVESLLHCAMLEHAEDACNVLAVVNADNISSFVTQMNAYAVKTGCTATTFSSPNQSKTTAQDTALLLQAALSYPLFQELAATELYDLPETDKNSSRTLLGNTVFTSSLDVNYYAYASFAFAPAEETALFATAEKDDISLLAIVCGTESGACYRTAAALFDWAFQHFQYSDVLTTKTVVAEVPVTMAKDGANVKLCPSQSISLLIPNKETMNFDIQYIYHEEQLSAPISVGTVLGEVQILHDGVVYSTTNLIAANAVARSEKQYLRTQLLSTLFRPAVLIAIAVVLVLLVLYIVSIVHYRRNRRAYLHQKTALAGAASQGLSSENLEPLIPALSVEQDSTETMEPSLSAALESEKSREPEPEASTVPPTEFKKLPKRDLNDLNDLFKDL